MNAKSIPGEITKKTLADEENDNRFSGIKGRRYAVSGVSEFSEHRGKPQFVFLGDSITDPAHIGCTENYWQFLAEDLGVTPLVYGVNGHQMVHLDGQAQKFAAEHPEGADAIFGFAGHRRIADAIERHMPRAYMASALESFIREIRSRDTDAGTKE